MTVRCRLVCCCIWPKGNSSSFVLSQVSGSWWSVLISCVVYLSDYATQQFYYNCVVKKRHEILNRADSWRTGWFCTISRVDIECKLKSVCNLCAIEVRVVDQEKNGCVFAGDIVARISQNGKYLRRILIDEEISPVRNRCSSVKYTYQIVLETWHGSLSFTKKPMKVH